METISKSLKIKNRIAGEVSRLREIFVRENCKRENENRSVDMEQLLKDLDAKEKELVSIKSKIAIASSAIAEDLALLSELKGKLSWVKGLTITEGVVNNRFLREQESETWNAFVGTAKRDELVVELQKQVNELQDKIDDFNASTTI